MDPTETALPPEPPADLPRTLGALRAAGHHPVPLREELRRNLMRLVHDGTDVFPGIVGYEDTVQPQLENAILAGQDIMLLGERGQAKTRLVRALTNLLDEWVPVLPGLPIPEHPLAPVTAAGRRLVAEHGDACPVGWWHRDARYAEKLATPDTSMADLIGEVDPVKVAEGRHLDDEEVLHFGLVPRSHRGIFAINELPDLAERLQVGLLNLMEERDIQLRGFTVRLPVDVLVVATANPEDYTNRGRIITPLKDRYGAQVRTHYPQTLAQEMTIMLQEAERFAVGDYRVVVPTFMAEVVAELVHLARRSPDVSQRSGVSVRASIAGYEALVANALRRAIRVGEQEVVPRVSDLPFLVPGLMGKIEFETFEDGAEDEVLERLCMAAVKNVFDRRLDVHSLGELAAAFEGELAVDTGEALPAARYQALLSDLPVLRDTVTGLVEDTTAAQVASGVEFVLEGLHLHQLLNKHPLEPGAHSYRAH